MNLFHVSNHIKSKHQKKFHQNVALNLLLHLKYSSLLIVFKKHHSYPSHLPSYLSDRSWSILLLTPPWHPLKGTKRKLPIYLLFLLIFTLKSLVCFILSRFNTQNYFTTLIPQWYLNWFEPCNIEDLGWGPRPSASL